MLFSIDFVTYLYFTVTNSPYIYKTIQCFKWTKKNITIYHGAIVIFNAM